MKNTTAIPEGGLAEGETSQLILGVQHCINQCDQLLAKLSTEDYVACSSGNASVGAHVRHILDRFHSFFSGLQSASVDYDDRKRDKSIETNLEAAVFALSTVGRRIVDPQLFEALSRDIKVRETVHHQQPPVEIASRVDRELMSLISHSTHHLALIAMLVRPMGYQMDSDFGKAPSTILYEQS